MKIFKICAFCKYYDRNYHILYEVSHDEKYKNLGYCKYSKKDHTLNQSTGSTNWCDHWEAASIEEICRRRFEKDK